MSESTIVFISPGWGWFLLLLLLLPLLLLLIATDVGIGRIPSGAARARAVDAGGLRFM